jgi:hypothetical protein
MKKLHVYFHSYLIKEHCHTLLYSSCKNIEGVGVSMACELVKIGKDRGKQAFYLSGASGYSVPEFHTGCL